ncbi:hypothetical protein T07_5362 [Trichinella nelsoni]|uniref:Uncharacterized protein n=1 Tax=Trichinella nelsoni TaxID=6336 RepID=A0A0V0SB95_9BILA|nr:hypothetical protein T07_5362 [Trichinella nelsoni]
MHAEASMPACLPACVYETAAALMKSRLVNAEVFEVCEKIPTYLPFVRFSFGQDQSVQETPACQVSQHCANQLLSANVVPFVRKFLVE